MKSEWKITEAKRLETVRLMCELIDELRDEIGPNMKTIDFYRAWESKDIFPRSPHTFMYRNPEVYVKAVNVGIRKAGNLKRKKLVEDFNKANEVNE